MKRLRFQNIFLFNIAIQRSKNYIKVVICSIYFENLFFLVHFDMAAIEVHTMYSAAAEKLGAAFFT